MSRIIISGSDGFIGKHLVAKISKNKKYKLTKMGKKMGDISKKETWDKLPKAKILIHLAAKTFVPDSWNNSEKFFETNVLGTLMALEYCKKNKAKIIFLSSYLYGNADKFPTNENEKIKIDNPYSLTKKTAEDFCKLYSREHGVNAIILRPSNAYGPKQKIFFLIPDMLKKLKKKKIIVNNIYIKRDLIYISDLVDAIIKSLSLKSRFDIINIGSGKSYNIKKIILTLQKICGVYYPIKNKGLKRPNEILSTQLNINKAKKILKWKPLYNLENGLKSTLYNKKMFIK
jgi:nucleoside-diphosphate-sugar epimerase